MKYIIDNKLFEAYPDLRIGIVVGRNINNGESIEKLRQIIGNNVNAFLDKYQSSDALMGHPNIQAWRETYKSFGVKPKDHKPTAEALLRRLINNHPFPRINSAVEAYLAVELLFMLPIGGYDIDKIKGDIFLRYSAGDEIFHPIGSEYPEKTQSGEVVYADLEKILTRRWNFKDAEISKIAFNSKNIILASEAAFPSINLNDLYGTIEKIVEYESEFCGGEYQKYFLDTNHREIIL